MHIKVNIGNESDSMKKIEKQSQPKGWTNDSYNIELLEQYDHLTVYINKMCIQIIYLIKCKKKDLALNNRQWYAIKLNQWYTLHETYGNQTSPIK